MAASARGCREEYCEESVKVAPDGGGKLRLAVAMENCSGVGRVDMRLAVMVGDRTVVATMVVVAIAASESSDNIHGFSKQFLAIDKISFDSLPSADWFRKPVRQLVSRIQSVDWFLDQSSVTEAMAASARGCREEYCEESIKVAQDGGGKVRLAVAMENCSGVGRVDMRLAVMVGDRIVVATMVVVAIAALESSDNIHGFSKQFLAIDKINLDSLLAPPPLAFSGGGACYLALPPPPCSPSVSLCLGTTAIHRRDGNENLGLMQQIIEAQICEMGEERFRGRASIELYY
nr:hypothetical protein Iba_chr14aCG6330 [Ipomoea batatas]